MFTRITMSTQQEADMSILAYSKFHRTNEVIMLTITTYSNKKYDISRDNFAGIERVNHKWVIRTNDFFLGAVTVKKINGRYVRWLSTKRFGKLIDTHLDDNGYTPKKRVLDPARDDIPIIRTSEDFQKYMDKLEREIQNET